MTSVVPPESSASTEADALTLPPPEAQGHGTRATQTYVLILLMTIYAVSLVDRISIGIVQEPIKREFGFTDFQLGLLGGPAFAVLYSLLGLPAAQLAERRSRTDFVAVSLAIWSVATAACGMAVGYFSLFLARLGVSIGEAGGVPPSQTLIADYFPASRRTTALSIYGLGVPLAILISGFGGGWLAEVVGWRLMFLLLAIPGVFLAVLLKFTVRDPPRSYQPIGATLNLLPQLRELASNATLWHLTLGASMSCFVGYGLTQYLVSFLMRAHDLSLLQAASFNGVMFGVFAGIGTYGCGYLCDRLAPRFPRVTTWLPAAGMLVAAPLYLAGYLATSLWVAAPFLMLGAMFNYFYVGTMYAAVYAVVPAALRTLATAATILFMSLLGYGLGPPIIGLMSDALRAHALAQGGLSAAVCAGSPAVQLAKSCAQASASGLRLAIVISLAGYVWAGLHFLASVTTVRKDVLKLAAREV